VGIRGDELNVHATSVVSEKVASICNISIANISDLFLQFDVGLLSTEEFELLLKPNTLGDGDKHPGGKCTSCQENDFACTYREPAMVRQSVPAFLHFLHSLQKRGPSKEYVQELEDRIEKLESFVRHVCIRFRFLFV